MSDLLSFLMLFAAFYAVAMLGLNLGLARFVPARFSRYRTTLRCYRYVTHTTYVLTAGDDITLRWNYIQPRYPSDNGRIPISRRFRS